jgi:transposase
MSKRQAFSREFKLEAVRLLQSGEKPAADLARELGVPRNRLYKWHDEVAGKGADGVFPGHGRRPGTEAELAKLKRENWHLPHSYRQARCWISQLVVLCEALAQMPAYPLDQPHLRAQQ